MQQSDKVKKGQDYLFAGASYSSLALKNKTKPNPPKALLLILVGKRDYFISLVIVIIISLIISILFSISNTTMGGGGDPCQLQNKF